MGANLRKKRVIPPLDSLRAILPGALRVNANPLHTDLWRKPGPGMAMYSVAFLAGWGLQPRPKRFDHGRSKPKCLGRNETLETG